MDFKIRSAGVEQKFFMKRGQEDKSARVMVEPHRNLILATLPLSQAQLPHHESKFILKQECTILRDNENKSAYLFSVDKSEYAKLTVHRASLNYYNHNNIQKYITKIID